MGVSEYVCRLMGYGLSLGAFFHLFTWFLTRGIYMLSSAIEGKHLG